MSNNLVHPQDRYREVSMRQARERDTWVRDQRNRLDARLAAADGPRHGLLLRFVGALAHLVGRSADAATTPMARSHRTAHRH